MARISRNKKKLYAKLEELAAENRPTNRLWIQYFQMVTLIKNFIESARCTSWEAYLKYIRPMIPVFHAAGHNLYAKCAHIFIQEMQKLNINEHQDFFQIALVE